MAKLSAYLSFKNQAQEALEFYQSALGGELDVSTYDSTPDIAAMLTDPADGGLVMHGQLDAPGGLTLMAADTGSAMPYVAPTSGVTVALTGGPDDDGYIRSAYDRLSEGVTPDVPLELAPWGDYYGQLTDKFGISWMFDIGTQ